MLKRINPSLGQDVSELIEMATSIIGDEQLAREWFNVPNIGLHDRRPAELLSNAEGYQKVKDLLIRIGSGVLA